MEYKSDNYNNNKSLESLRLLNLNNNFIKKYEGNKNKRFRVNEKDKIFWPLSNNGVISYYTNSCLYISILSYLNNVLGININIHQLRQIGKLNTNENNAMFDDRIPRHEQGLQDIVNRYNLEIIFLNVKSNGKLYDKSDFSAISNIIKSNGRNRNRFYICSYGLHFELVIFSNLWNINLKNYFPNEQIENISNKFLVFDKNENDYIDINELKFRNKLLSKEINNLENELKSKKEVLKLVDSSIKRDINFDIADLLAEISNYKAERKTNELKIEKANKKRIEYKVYSMEKNKKIIKEYINQFKTKRQFAIDTLLKAKIEFQNNLRLLINFPLSEEEKHFHRAFIRKELKEIDDALKKLEII